jgi:hypothetical protein
MSDEREELEKELSEQRKRLAETEKRARWVKEMQLTETLEKSLRNLEDIRQEFALSQNERLEVKKVSESMDTQLNEVLTLLKQYVADNKRAVDGINQYLKDWK